MERAPGKNLGRRGKATLEDVGAGGKERGGGPYLSPTWSAAGAPVGEDPLRGTTSFGSSGQAGAGQAGMENGESVIWTTRNGSRLLFSHYDYCSLVLISIRLKGG